MPEPKPTRTAPPWLKPTVDYGPLMVFLAFYFATDLLAATAALTWARTAARAESWLPSSFSSWG